MRFLGALATALLYMQPAAAAGAASNKTADDPMLQLSADSSFNFELLISLSNAGSGGGDIGQVLGAAKDIVPGDMASFSEHYHRLAREAKARAEDPALAYDPVNVRDTWFAAAHYFRRADFYLHRNWSDPRIDAYGAEQTAAFDKARAALPYPNHRVRIPTCGFTVEAVWYGFDDGETGAKARKRPTLVIGNGYDGAQEDSYHFLVAAAHARGWNCITYEGPGQCTVRRTQNKGFIPDWERVVTPVVDYVLSSKADRVDPDRLVLVGISLGGYLAARAAAFEKRLAAAVLIGGVWDVYEAFTAQLPPQLKAVGASAKADEAIMAVRDSGKLPTSAAWGLDQGLWSFYTHSPTDFLNQVKAFNLRAVADRITLPVFVGDAQYEGLLPGQAVQVKAALGKNATLHVFNGTAGYHCQAGAGEELARTVFACIYSKVTYAASLGHESSKSIFNSIHSSFECQALLSHGPSTGAVESHCDGSC